MNKRFWCPKVSPVEIVNNFWHTKSGSTQFVIEILFKYFHCDFQGNSITLFIWIPTPYLGGVLDNCITRTFGVTAKVQSYSLKVTDCLHVEVLPFGTRTSMGNDFVITINYFHSVASAGDMG